MLIEQVGLKVDKPPVIREDNHACIAFSEDPGEHKRTKYIDYRHFFHPLHKQPFIDSKETLAVSEHLYNKGLILPTYTGLKNKDIDFISKVVLDIVW